MFSGVTAQKQHPLNSGAAVTESGDSVYGEWRDCHMPMQDQDEPALESGMMTGEAIANTMRTVPEHTTLLFSGCKITALHSGLWVAADPEKYQEDDTKVRVALNEKLARYIQSLQS